MATAKINPELLKEIEKTLKDPEKKIKFSSAKQFVDLAVLDLLEKEEGERDG